MSTLEGGASGATPSPIRKERKQSFWSKIVEWPFLLIDGICGIISALVD